MRNRLFIIEGLPCTGKSTTAKFVYDLLSKSQNCVLCFDEDSRNHPADYEFHAFITDDKMDKLTNDEKDTLFKVATRKELGYVIPLAEIEGELFDKVIQYKIYDMLPWETESWVMLEHWNDFAKEAQLNENTYVFNCCFLQNPMCETMMRFNFAKTKSEEHIFSIYEKIKNLNPIIIYLKNTKIANRIKEVSNERDKNWLNSVIEYHILQGYGKEHNLVGFEGYVSCLDERQKNEISILNKLPINKLVIENPFDNWVNTYKNIENFICGLLV